MQTIVKQTHDATLVTVTGALDSAASRAARALFKGILDEDPERLVVDLSEVDFVDSSGLGVLVGVLKQVRTKETDLRLAGVSDSLLSLFELTRLDTVFEMYETVEAATA